MKISFIQPSRNNLKYLKWSYDSIRKNQGRHEVEICIADDFSNDGTWEWCLQRMKEDNFFKAIRNEGPTRLGHTILYDRLINEVATNDIAIIYHADMYLCPFALDAIEQYINPGTIVSLTRIEPPLHPPGPEKLVYNFGTEPEDFNEERFLEWFSEIKNQNLNKTTEGIFAPWAFYRKDFQDIGGHDPLFAPQSKEDSDIFNRFLLNGIKFIQTWEGCVYHMTCRGSRFNPSITTVGKESTEWLEQNDRSARNFIRKWGHFVKHNEFMKPIVPSKYNVGIVLNKANSKLVSLLEPWCDKLFIDDEMGVLFAYYYEQENKNTMYDLTKRVFNLSERVDTEVVVTVDGNNFTQQDFLIIQQLSEILDNQGQEGKFEIGNLTVSISNLNRYQNELIHV